MPVDIFATKGTEYLLVVVYLVLLIALVRYIAPRPNRAAAGAPQRARGADTWFVVRDDRQFHPGHGWVSAGAGDVVTVGLDDFAAHLVGVPDAVALPRVGAHVRQGGQGWELTAGGRRLGMRSPVEGDVVAVNEAVLAAPRLAAEDPYGEGWLLKVHAPDRQVWLRNLISGELARVWMQHTAERLSRLLAGGLGAVMADGGRPARGFAHALAQEEWEAVTRELFLAE
jgi:glycine cleavage system H protein